MTTLLALFLIAATARAHTPSPVPCTTLLIGGITYRIPQLPPEGFTLRPRPGRVNGLIQSDRQVRSLAEEFRFDGLSRAYRPLSVFAVRDRTSFREDGATDVLDLLVKSPGMDYVFPSALAQFREVLQRIINTEHLINPRARDDYYAYVTVHQSDVEAGTTQRQSGWQLDGFQGIERSRKQEIDHSYLVSDALPEVFTDQRFHFRGFDYQLHNVFSELDRQALPEFEVQGVPYQVYLANAYTAHRASFAISPVRRTFLRVTYSRARFDKLGSTENPLLPYSWDRPQKTLRNTFAKYVPSVGMNLLNETHSFDQVRGERLGLISLGGADARVAAHVAEMLIATGRHVEFLASVRPSLAYTGGQTLAEDVLLLTRNFRPLNPIAETAFSERLTTYLLMQPGDLKGALLHLINDHDVDGLVIVDVGGRALSPIFGQDTPLLEHRVQDAVNAQAREKTPYRTLIVAAPGYGLPADAGDALFTKARRYRPTAADIRRVEVSASTWDNVKPTPDRHEVAAQMWRQALTGRFGPQDFTRLNPQDPAIEIKPEHQDLLILSLDDVQASTVRRIR